MSSLPQDDSSQFARRFRRTGPNQSHVSRVLASRGQSLLPFADPVPVGAYGYHDPATTPSNTPGPETQQPEAAERIGQAPPTVATGEKARARDILAAIRTLKAVERERRQPSTDERDILARFGGFGPVALSIFSNPQTGDYKPGWREIGEELKSLLTPEEYDSARRTTFSQFFTSPAVMAAMHEALERLGVPADGLVLEPGCGVGKFMTGPHRYIGVELDGISGRIARALNPHADIRIENFRDTKLPPLDAVIGNVPFADIRLELNGRRLSLHDYFIAKSVDALKPGGVLAVVTSHFTLDKQNAEAREYLSSKADFLGAIRLPSSAFKAEGTSVTTDIVIFRRRAPGQGAAHADPEWLETSEIGIAGADIPVNRYFLNHHEMVLGDWSRKDTLYGSGFSVSPVGELASQLKEAVGRIVEQSAAERPNPPPQLETSTYPIQFPSGNVQRISEIPGEVKFSPPPPLRHVTEGSFFVGDDKVIRQVEDGNAGPVTYGGTLLKSDGTMTGRRLASLIDLRDKARRVLQSQNEGWPESHRQEARRDLNHAYDRFSHAYGPINRTTTSETKDGGQVRRMPNLVKFCEDPDAMLVMALEEYDEATGIARKAPILLRDVVGPKPPITRVSSAEEGLLVSLNSKGVVDLGYISTLYGKSSDEIISELGDLIFRNPESKAWETADQYLSGNVREKLKIAEAAGAEFERNAAALRSVQPEDVLPGDIDANLGAPWIPAADIKAFAEGLFGGSVAVGHLKKDAVWSIEPDYRAISSVAATADFGTSRINGTELFAQAMNQKSPLIYDTVFENGSETRVINPTETQSAKEKQKLIKERFKSWVFSDPDRTERLVRAYNDTYNNLRPRLFDGSHLDFPGMSKAVTLRPHQVDAVWRCMSGGNTLLAHAVGAGKTYEMCAAGMKMKQAGIIKKPMYCIANNMLEQFSREFLQLYPNAKLLVATKEDLTKDRRKLLTAKIATGDWDGIIVTHSSFERIGMSKEYQEKFLREQIKEYEALLVDKASQSRNIIKTLEKQKANREEKLKDLLAENKKDDGLCFDELGIDYLFVDESAMSFKNLETPTKMERVAGIQTGGSERAFDLYMKARYLDEKHPGHGVTFATGTPISNTMVEMYTNQRFLDPKGLSDRGIEHFDAWAATFGEVVDSMEISPDGASLRPRSRFAKFVNLPELVQMFRAFADVQTAEMLDLPRPKLEGGKPQTVACPMSEDQAELQAGLIKRYDRIRNQRVDPREDNALAITTDGRKLALDGRMLGAGGDFHDSKINALVANVVQIWERTAATRGTQMIFSDMGVNAHPFSAYDEIVGKLAERGIPRSQIACIGDADSDAKKQALFEKVRQGTVRVLLGSTAKMGTGTNVQKRLVALHHLDAPWKPAEVEQRDGRILRQGNENPEVAIYRYVTEGSFDAYMWQALETKARFIAQVMSGECAARKAEDVVGQELSYAEVKAIASGNPAVLTLAEADAELQRLAILRKNHADEQYLARRAVRDLPDEIRRLAKRLEGLTADMATMEGSDFTPSQESVADRLRRMPEKVSETYRTPLGKYRGLDASLIMHPLGGTEVVLDGAVRRRETLMRDNPGPRAVLNALERLADGYDSECRRLRAEIGIKQGQFQDFEGRLGKEFAHGEYMSQLTDLRDRLKDGLSEKAQQETENEGPTVAELAERIKALRESHTVEAAPERTVRKAVRAELPVTARIRGRVGLSAESGREAAQGEAENHAVVTPEVAESKLVTSIAETAPAEPAAPEEPKIMPMPGPVKAVEDFRRKVAEGRKGDDRQLRLF